MPIRHRMQTEPPRVRVEVEGDLTTDEMLQAIDKALDDPEFVPGCAILSDHTRIGNPLTPDQVEALSSHLQKRSHKLGGCRWAVVTTRPASFGMMNMLAVSLQRVPLRLRAFRSLEEAAQWLDASANSGRIRNDRKAGPKP